MDTHGQASGIPTPSIEISTDTYERVNIKYFADSPGMGSNIGDGIHIYTDEFSVSIDWFINIDAPIVNIEMSNSENPYDWTHGVIRLQSSGFGRYDELDPSVLPQDIRYLWESMMVLVGEVINDEGFWDLVNSGDDEEEIRELLLMIQDGSHAPTMQHRLYGLTMQIGSRSRITGEISRGYSLYGPIGITINTASPVHDPNPEIYIEVDSMLPENRWYFYLNPETETINVRWDGGDMDSMDEREPIVQNVVSTLKFFKTQIPSLIEFGVIHDPTELENLIDKSLEWFDSFSYSVGL